MLMVLVAKAQTGNTFLGETKLVFQSEDKLGKSFEAHSGYAYMSLSMSTGEFILNVDLITLRAGEAGTDTLILKGGEQLFLFKGNIDENILKFAQQADDEKMYDMQGTLNLNGGSALCSAQFDPISFSDKNDIRNYRMDFRMQVDASKFNIKGFDSRVSKQFVVEVTGGRVNILN